MDGQKDGKIDGWRDKKDGKARIRINKKVEIQMCRCKEKEGYREKYETKRHTEMQQFHYNHIIGVGIAS
jgi:hypothetical protein